MARLSQGARGLAMADQQRTMHSNTAQRMYVLRYVAYALGGACKAVKKEKAYIAAFEKEGLRLGRIEAIHWGLFHICIHSRYHPAKQIDLRYRPITGRDQAS